MTNKGERFLIFQSHCSTKLKLIQPLKEDFLLQYWDDGLAAEAQALADTCVSKHNNVSTASKYPVLIV